jgi:glucokinase
VDGLSRAEASTPPHRSPAVVGLDVGGTKVHGVLLVDGVVARETRLPVRPGVHGVVDRVAEVVRLLTGDDGPPVAVGVGVPGVVDAGTVAHAVNLGIVSPAPLGRLLTDRLGTRAVVENDLDVAALGASRVLGLTGDLAYLSLGTGLAAGLLLGGRLLRGHGGAAGEIGHLTYRHDGSLCACGQRGCLELYGSGSALDARWSELLRAGARGVRHGTGSATPAPVQVFAAADAGDARAVILRDDFAEAVAHAVRTLVLTTGAEHVVLGGGVSHVGQPLLDVVRGALRRRAATSPFLSALALEDRLRLGPEGVAVASVGAAIAAGGVLRTGGDDATRARAELEGAR